MRFDLRVLVPKDPRQRTMMAVAAVAVLVAAIGLGVSGSSKPVRPSAGGRGAPGLNVTWDEPVAVSGEGYEPGLATDSKGVLYYTAHKDQSNRVSYPYLASWFLISKDSGKTWTSPTDPFPLGQKWERYPGDEGDIGVDAQDFVYFVDTYLIDNHLHVWANGGVWQYSEHIQKSTGLDDRPWIVGQGTHILHYLGNNGNEVNGGRYWYYRSTNGGRTWTNGDSVPGNGWALIDAERFGSHVYIIDESEIDAEADIRVWASEDQGVTWDWGSPAIVGHRNGTGSAYPLIAAGANGAVFALWNDITDGEANGTHIFLGRSTDYGKTWNSSEITPFKLYSYYQALTVSAEGELGVAFYGTPDVPVSDNSSWYLYGALQRNGDLSEFDLNFSKASQDPVYTGARVNALGDLFECVVTPDHAFNIAYEVRTNVPSRLLYFVRGSLPDE